MWIPPSTFQPAYRKARARTEAARAKHPDRNGRTRLLPDRQDRHPDEEDHGPREEEREGELLYARHGVPYRSSEARPPKTLYRASVTRIKRFTRTSTRTSRTPVIARARARARPSTG